MTLGIALPLFCLIIGAGEFVMFRHWRANGMITASAAKLLLIASASLPVVVYVILNFVLPDVGAIEIF